MNVPHQPARFRSNTCGPGGRTAGLLPRSSVYVDPGAWGAQTQLQRPNPVDSQGRSNKNSNRNEGTRSLATNAVGIRRQAGGSDGCRAVDRFGRVVGADRGAAAEGGAAV